MKQKLLKTFMLMLMLMFGMGVWAEEPVYYEKISGLSDIVNNGKYIIVISDGTNNYAVQKGTTNFLSVSFESDGSIKDPSTNIIWTATSTSTTNVFKFASSSTYIYNSGSNTTLSSNSNNSANWLISSPASGVYKMNLTNGDGRYIAWSGSKFAAYANSNYNGGNAEGTNLAQYHGALYIYKLRANTAAYTVTFNAGTNGSCSTESLTESAASAGITLPSVTANTGYVFKGWSASTTPSSADAGNAGNTYKPSGNVTLYAYYVPTYTLTITQPAAGGTLTVSDANGALESGATVEAGTNLICEVTNIPEGKRFSRFFVTYDDGGNKYKLNNPATFDNIPTSGITAAEVTVTYMDVPQYTVTYKVFGSTVGTEDVYENHSIANAPTPSVEGWTLTGWTTDDSYVSSETAPSIFNSPITSDVVLHAVFSQSTGNGPGEATLTNKEICDNLTNSYATSSITNSYGTWNYNAAKQGNYSSDGEYFMQLRNNSTTVSYLQIPEVSGNITSIVLGRVCNTSKAKYTGSIYFRETAANDATNIATATQATALTDVTLEIPAGYSTGYVMVSAACRIESVTVNYVDGVTTYTIADPRPKTTINITTPEGYSTFYCEDAIEMPEGVDGSTVTVAGGELTLAWEYQAGDVVPAGTPILVKGTEGRHTATITTGGDPVGTNYLIANTTGEVAEAWYIADDLEEDSKYYVLSYDSNDENLGFYWFTETGNGEFNVPEGKVFLHVPASVQAPARFIFGDTETAIKSISTVENGATFNLAGQRVGNDYKGIVIKNGKKYLNK